MTEATATEEKESASRLDFASLPDIEGLVAETRARVARLLHLLDEATDSVARWEKLVDEYKTELADIQATTGRTGFRHEQLCFVSQLVKGRKTLDKMALIEHGCPALVIAKSYVEGKPSIRKTFKRLPED